MNDQTQIQPYQQSTGYSATADMAVELARALALVAPITMTSEQQEVWLRAAMDALVDIRADEVAAVSVEARRTVTRPSQIVPEIARLVGERRKHKAIVREYEWAALPGPPIRKHVMERDRSKFTAEDWAELNEHLERQSSIVRYNADGSRYTVQSQETGEGR